jgi:type IV secretory pathway TraG/TraD family ATPase VirD4
MVGMRFSSSRRYVYEPGALYLGQSPILRRDVWIKSEKHAITVGAPRSGKDAALVTPNLYRWQGNALVIDPKGEAAEATAVYRNRVLGQRVAVVAPFGNVNVPDDLLGCFNPFDSLNPDDLTFFEDMRTIASALIVRHDPRAGHWDSGATDIVAGEGAHTATACAASKRNLLTLRNLLRMPEAEREKLGRLLQANGGGFGLPQSAAAALTLGKESQGFLSTAITNTTWLDSPSFMSVLRSSSFTLDELKHGTLTVYLVLPPERLSECAGFLRLFVMMALDAMARGGTKGRECLFVMNEFFSLGYIEKIAKSAGLMPGYGVKLWPILQDIGQLEKLYGRDGMETFFGTSDAAMFFGNTDQKTLEYVSRMIGTRFEAGMMGAHAKYVGKPFLSAREVRAHVAKKRGAKVARRMIVFAQGDDVLSVRLKPYFEDRRPWRWALARAATGWLGTRLARLRERVRFRAREQSATALDQWQRKET